MTSDQHRLRDMLQTFVDGRDRSIQFANEIEALVLLEDPDSPIREELSYSLAMYSPASGSPYEGEEELARLFRYVLREYLDDGTPPGDVTTG